VLTGPEPAPAFHVDRDPTRREEFLSTGRIGRARLPPSSRAVRLLWNLVPRGILDASLLGGASPSSMHRTSRSGAEETGDFEPVERGLEHLQEEELADVELFPLEGFTGSNEWKGPPFRSAMNGSTWEIATARLDGSVDWNEAGFHRAFEQRSQKPGESGLDRRANRGDQDVFPRTVDREQGPR
jgi:hypothetical protein